MCNITPAATAAVAASVTGFELISLNKICPKNFKDSDEAAIKKHYSLAFIQDIASDNVFTAIATRNSDANPFQLAERNKVS